LLKIGALVTVSTRRVYVTDFLEIALPAPPTVKTQALAINSWTASISTGFKSRLELARRKYGKISQSPERGMQDSPDRDNGIPNSRADAVPAKSGRLW
jgi:hypothetical protein